MRVICSWCNSFLRNKDGGPDDVITHGICASCEEKVKEEVRAYQKAKEERNADKYPKSKKEISDD